MAPESNLANLAPLTATLLDRLCVVDAQIRAIAQRATLSPQSVLMSAYYGRLLGWMMTLTAADHPMQFQAIAAGSRALLEILVDMLYLHGPQPGAVAEQMNDWELSARHQGGVGLLRHHAGDAGQLAELASISNWLAGEDGRSVEGKRLKHGWLRKGKPSHPQRWSNDTLPGMIHTLSKRQHCVACQWLPLSDIYAEHNPTLCWYTHGSGFAGLRNLNAVQFEIASATHLYQAWFLASTAAQVAVHHFKISPSVYGPIRQATLEAATARDLIFGRSPGAADIKVPPPPQ